jgi:hypothetical protein
MSVEPLVKKGTFFSLAGFGIAIVLFQHLTLGNFIGCQGTKVEQFLVIFGISLINLRPGYRGFQSRTSLCKRENTFPSTI